MNEIILMKSFISVIFVAIIKTVNWEKVKKGKGISVTGCGGP
jgi:hypothetical protein